MRSSPAKLLSSALVTLTILVGGAGCTGESSPSSAANEPPPLRDPILELETVEELSEAAANRLIEFSDAVRRRDFARARDYLTGDFLGPRLGELSLAAPDEILTGTRRSDRKLAADSLPIVGRVEFIDSLASLLGPYESIDHAFLKTRGAEFQRPEAGGQVERGLVRLTLHIVGRRSDARPLALYGWAHGAVQRTEKGWSLSRLVLDRFRVLDRSEPFFTDVTRVAGTAHQTPQLKKQKNPNFYWQGAATADIDGDGLYDIFSAASHRNFLYRNLGNGRFEDITKAANLEQPAGVTGPVFLDHDNDGDPDLFCGYVGWEVDGVPRGNSLRLFRNDGKGRFEDVSFDAGVADHHVAFSAAVADVNNDGWLDIFVCGYNRLDAVYPNHWFRATNGTPNALYRNRGDGTFENVARESGVAGSAWAYAAAFADFDEDGDQDLYVANDYGDNNLFRNRGDGTFEDVAAELGVLDTGNGMGTAWGDLDNDGKLDLYVSNMSSSAGNRILKRLMEADQSDASRVLYKGAAGNTIFKQTGDGFSLVPASAGGIGASWAWGVSLLDLNLDGILDIYVANGFISGDSLKDT